MRNFILSAMLCLVASLAASLSAVSAGATDYPLEITDLSGRTVEIKAEPQRIVIQDGRDIFALALLDREDPFRRLVAWNNILGRSDPKTWDILRKAWPQSSAQAVDMKFGDEGQVNLEEVVSRKPDLLVFQVRVKQALEESDLFNRLAALDIPIILIDTEIDPARNAPATVALLGKVLNRETEAQAYNAFYGEKLAAVQAAIEGAEKPKVFVEAMAGRKGPEFCCFTHGDKFWGRIVEASGGSNIGTKFLGTKNGDVTTETVISEAPDVFLMTGSGFAASESVSPGFGFGADRTKVVASLGALTQRNGFSHIKAIRNGRVLGLYHGLYASVFNIYAIEMLAKSFHPERLGGLDPDADLNRLLAQFTDLPTDAPVVLGAALPAPAP